MLPTRHRPDPERLTAWRLLRELIKSAPPDQSLSSGEWDAVAALAEELRLAPLLYHNLFVAERASAIDTGRLSTATRYRLHAAARRSSLALLRAERTLAEVCSVFETAHVRYLVLKGPALSHTLYPTPDCRPMSDLDLLIAPDDRQAASSALSAAGWENQQTDTSEINAVLEFSKADPGLLPIEIHWELLHFEWFNHNTRFQADHIWSNTRWCSSATTPFILPGPEDLLIYLCMHAAIHHALGEMWLLVDVDRLASSGNLDWELMTDRAIAGNVASAVYFALEYARLLLGSDIPEEALHRLRPSNAIIRRVDRLAPPERCITGNPPMGPQALRALHFWLMDDSSARWQGLVRAVFPGRAWLERRYEPATTHRSLAMIALWHPIRVAGLGLKAARQLLPRPTGWR